jgi:hypothetical protein
MRINVAIPEAHVDAHVLNAALESVTRLDERMLAGDEIPTFHEAVRRGVRWKPEPPGQEHFDHAGVVLARKWGDCDDLAPWHAASLRATGEDPDARAVVRRSGPKRWHAIVQRSDGSLDDPSREAGMGQPHSVRGASLPLMYPVAQSVGGVYVPPRPSFALRPYGNVWQARTDMPMVSRRHPREVGTPTDYAMVTLHSSPVEQLALTGAIDGACRLALAGGYARPDDIHRICAIADAVEGMGYAELAGIYGDEHAAAATALVGSFFKKFAKRMGKIAKGGLKLARPFIKYIPGIGPVASDSLAFAEKIAAKLHIPKIEALQLLKKGETFPTIAKPPPGTAPREPPPATPYEPQAAAPEYQAPEAVPEPEPSYEGPPEFADAAAAMEGWG